MHDLRGRRNLVHKYSIDTSSQFPSSPLVRDISYQTIMIDLGVVCRGGETMQGGLNLDSSSCTSCVHRRHRSNYIHFDVNLWIPDSTHRVPLLDVRNKDEPASSKSAIMASRLLATRVLYCRRSSNLLNHFLSHSLHLKHTLSWITSTRHLLPPTNPHLSPPRPPRDPQQVPAQVSQPNLLLLPPLQGSATIVLQEDMEVQVLLRASMGTLGGRRVREAGGAWERVGRRMSPS